MDGAIDVVDADVALVTWSPGYRAVSYNIYLSLGTQIDESNFVGTVDVPEFSVPITLLPGAIHSWRVDAVYADGNTHVGDGWRPTAPDLEDQFPRPAGGAVGRQRLGPESPGHCRGRRLLCGEMDSRRRTLPRGPGESGGGCQGRYGPGSPAALARAAMERYVTGHDAESFHADGPLSDDAHAAQPP